MFQSLQDAAQKIKNILLKLIKTFSRAVQKGISNCLIVVDSLKLYNFTILQFYNFTILQFTLEYNFVRMIFKLDKDF